jgi:hypothetical protein
MFGSGTLTGCPVKRNTEFYNKLSLTLIIYMRKQSVNLRDKTCFRISNRTKIIVFL